MNSVAARSKAFKQPYGGYLRPTQFALEQRQDGQTLLTGENTSASVIGMAVDYLTRYLLRGDLHSAFSIPLRGAAIAELYLGRQGISAKAKQYLLNVTSIDDASVAYACKLASFSNWSRDPDEARAEKSAEETEPNLRTIRNIQVMTMRSLDFFKEKGPILRDHVTFEDDGYTQVVSSGDGDYLTADALWDLQVTKAKLTTKNTLQLLMEYIMGLHSKKPEFQSVRQLGIFNPRLNAAYTLPVAGIPADVIRAVEKDVVCYP